VLLGPLRPNAAALAKQALSVNALSDGRLTLGIGLGARGDDYEVSGIETAGRGKSLTEMLERMTEIWSGDEVGPRTAGAPRLLVGGHVEESFARAARFGEGWIAGGAPPNQYAEMIKGVRAAWEQAGRSDAPRTAGLAYYALGDQAESAAHSYLTDYYGFLGEETAEMIAQSAATDAETVQAYSSAFEEAGCGELIFFPCSSDAAQADLLAEAVGL
jgi:alkanesulfonate monooxygenase SsuD/methylene tetrahydromethanopterin reductase-like flavin-dependent oxidoreductase (luciferase family)